MKQRMQWIAALFTAASASLAMAGPGFGFYNGGCACPSDRVVRLEPVREVIVKQQFLAVQRPLVVKQTTCLMEPRSSNLSWGTPFHAAGSVISAPFVALGNTFSPSRVEPVGERLSSYDNTWTRSSRVTWRSEPMLMPVGERFTTVKYIRSKPLLVPVGERITVKKIHHHKKMLKPVGERFTTVKTYHKTILQPVGERFTTIRYIKTQPLLEPVGERVITTRRILMRPVLEPIGERTIIRTTRTYVNPWNSCDY